MIWLHQYNKWLQKKGIILKLVLYETSLLVKQKLVDLRVKDVVLWRKIEHLQIIG